MGTAEARLRIVERAAIRRLALVLVVVLPRRQTADRHRRLLNPRRSLHLRRWEKSQRMLDVVMHTKPVPGV